MTLYFVSYDLRQSRDYQSLYDELERFDAVRILQSTWCFMRTNTAPSNLRDHFREFIDGNDGLMVSEVSGWASVKTDGTPKEL